MTRVSVFMSSYNHARFLRQAIQSVLDQSFTDFELFIVDDASTDESWEIIRRFTDARIHATRNSVNRNDKEALRGFIREGAQGEFIAVQHSDNVWEPGKLQRQLEVLDAHRDVGAVFTNAQVIEENGQPLLDRSHFYYSIFDQPNRSRHEWLNFFFHHGNALCHPSVLIRRRCYDECGPYRDGLALIPDLDMWVRLCLKYEIFVIPDRLVQFRLMSGETYISGDRPETRIRGQFERLRVLDNYRSLTSFDELARVFPSAQKYRHPDGCDAGYVLARIALDDPAAPPFQQLFGLNLLFEALNDPPRAARIAVLYGFRHKDFAGLTGQYDVFSVEDWRVTRGRAWKIALFLNRIRDALKPPGRR